MPFATNDGARIYWRSDGRIDRPALVLGNSLGTDHHLWEPVLQGLTAHFRVIRFDKRGHGASDAPHGDYSMDLLGRDVLAVADAAGVERFSYLGISIGGMIGMWLAQHAGERLERMVLCNTGAKLPTEVWTERIGTVRKAGLAAVVDGVLARWFTERYRSRNDPRLGSVKATILGLDPEGYVGCCAAIRDMDLRPGLPGIRVPTLVTTGSFDQSTPKALGKAIATAIPGARLAELPAAHIPFYEVPVRFLQTVVPFLLGEAALTEAERYERGLARRKEVLGAAYVEARLAQRTPFNEEFQALITRQAWGELWTRPGLDDRTRRMLVLAMTAVAGRWEEFDLHARAGLAAELAADDVKEVLLAVSVYGGVPAANTGFQRAAALIAQPTQD